MREGLLNAVVGLLVLAAILVPLERTFAARRQHHLRSELKLDLVFFLFQYLAMAWVFLEVNRWLRIHVAAIGLHTFVESLPIPAQVVVAVVLGDLGLYWAHRLSHELPLLWRFHSVHHSVETLDWVAAHREHPLDGIYSQVFLNLPAFALGIDLASVMPVFVARGIWAIFIHSNITIPLGPLGILFGDPVLHRWHHARVAKCRHNFANLAPYLDVVFGTHHRPTNEAYALGDPTSPKCGFVRQLVAPFVPRFPEPSSAGRTTPPRSA